jgi:NAD+ synthase (glutamine-hydrolysing)
MRILVAQLDPTIGDLEGNCKKIVHFLEEGRKGGADIVLFPEMTICGYPPNDLVLHDNFVVAVEEALQKVIPKTKGVMAVVGLVRRNLALGEKRLCNSAAIIQDGKLMGFYDKQLLPTYDVFDERRYFEPGKETKIWEWKGKKIGVLICEDIWQHAGYVGDTRYQQDPVLELFKYKLDFMLNMSASPYTFEKPDVRVKVCQKSAKTLQCPVVLCCQVGGNDQLVFDGYSIYVDGEGNLRQLGKGFEEDALWVDLNAPACACPFQYDSIQDLYHALVLGTKDYFHKQGFKKGILGLSGGIDSALVACIATDAIGKENLHALAMPSQFSSRSSIQDASSLAKRLGIKIDEIPIESPFKAYLELLKPYFNGKPFDTMEENLQARIRGMVLMAFSNKLGYLVLSTGNKSEMAMGYCTLYGDMAGGLAVIADVTKTLVYKLAHWINRKNEIIPRSILEKEPSAELRPNQKDTDTLPEFAILDNIIQAYVEDFLSPEEIVKKYLYPKELIDDVIHKIHHAEYKRRQAPPAIRVSKKAFRVGRAYPIVQGWV